MLTHARTRTHILENKHRFNCAARECHVFYVRPSKTQMSHRISATFHGILYVGLRDNRGRKYCARLLVRPKSETATTRPWSIYNALSWCCCCLLTTCMCLRVHHVPVVLYWTHHFICLRHPIKHAALKSKSIKSRSVSPTFIPTYSEISLSRPPKIKTFYPLKTLFAKFKLFFSSFSTPSVSLIKDHLWDCPKVVFKTTFGQSQRWS